jgi:hypothetical protein
MPRLLPGTEICDLELVTQSNHCIGTACRIEYHPSNDLPDAGVLLALAAVNLIPNYLILPDTGPDGFTNSQYSQAITTLAWYFEDKYPHETNQLFATFQF